MSTPLSLDLPSGVTTGTIETTRGAFAVLSNDGVLAEEEVAEHSGEVALLVPGFMGSKEDFLAVMAPLGDRGVRAIAIDLRGQFESPPNQADEPYSLDLFAADVSAIIAGLSRKPHLVGHSFGGLVAREVVLANPLSVATLTLLNSGPSALSAAQQMRLQLFAQVLAENGLEAVWAAKQALEESEGTEQPNDPAIREFLTKRFLANSSGSLLAMVDVLCTVTDRTEELAMTSPPTLVCFGSNDDAWPAEEQRVMGLTLGASVIELRGLGHSPAVEDPTRTADALVEFWREHK